MVLSDVSIRRPVFTTMIMVAIVAFGAIAYRGLPVDLYPEVDFPVVTVTTVYPGADPGTIESRISEPIEEALNSLGGVESLSSVSVESVSQVVVQFELGVDLNAAAQDVRDRVAGVESELPDAAEAPTVEKLDLGAAPILQIAVHGGDDPVALSRWVEDVAEPRLTRIDGVGTIELTGGREREIHAWIRPDRLRAWGLTPLDVERALASQNVQIPAGRITGTHVEQTLRTSAEAHTVEALGDVVIATFDDAVVRLSDVVRLEDGLEEERSRARIDGAAAIAIVVQKRSGANTVEVADRVESALVTLREMAPPGVAIDVVQDNSVMVRGSIEAVQFDLVLGAVLAIAIILFFLRDLRATFISALALPTSVLGTAAFVGAMGFTLNLMTTLALSLSIGILIDDAIVVIENIVRRRSALGENAVDAAHRGTSEIGLAVFATTLSIVAVFVPVAFMDGMVGQFFYEFGLTVAAAVLISLFVSFTLTPMLSARMLRDHDAHPRGLSGWIERLLGAIEGAYRNVVAFALRFWPVTLVSAVAVLGATLAMAGNIGFEFTPLEDRNQFQIDIELPAGTSLATTASTAEAIAEDVRALPGVDLTFTTVGGGVQERVNTASITVNLIHRDERAYHQSEIMARVRTLLADRADIEVSVGEVGALDAGGRTEALQIGIGGDDAEAIGRVAEAIADRLREQPGFVDVGTTWRGGRDELDVAIDAARASDFGLTAGQIGATVRTLVAGSVATELSTGTDRIPVRLQLDPDARQSTRVVANAQVRAASGALVEIDQIATVHTTRSPTRIDRADRQKQVIVYANLDGVPLGEASTIAADIADELVPDDMVWSPEGTTEELQNTAMNMLFALGLAILCVYLILASQFESFVHPLTIMVSLPFSLIGALGALLLFDVTMSIFGMIGIIMLMGLVTKNAILLVDYANQLMAEGRDVRASLIEAGAVRLRPILMTTAAMVFGMLPVAIGHGDGGEARSPMGLIVIGGLLSSTVLTLVVVPATYLVVEHARRFAMRLVRRSDAHGAPTPAALDGAEG